ncbi:membrane protein implicated in regulation of membrane protease activity [Halarchaeum rubridurum]|uniref:Membrane protein implicated in regulation of membrane protease activity n=1 Tax=Halarchaeum rubridurum TaxID=489911 RepID=A0A830FTJ5_9EURY|nr:hypothetical protein [Halarchaeum rubridurum]MBP1954301.1 membrane protein implicated in regulation of membrane protease activity [Halarchaeum rubridurum]GGM58955.1 hypothetical protein GCM10009017_06350 [Halarchaeum rubridurum]
MHRAHWLAAGLLVLAAACLANPLYVAAVPEANVLGHASLSGDAAAFAPDLRYLARLALSACGVLALVFALASLFAGGLPMPDE